MPLIHKFLWYCCKREVHNTVELEVIDDELVSTTLYGFTLSPTEEKTLRYCPSCGTEVPSVKGIAILAGLQDSSE